MPNDTDIWDCAPSLSFENEATVEIRLILPLLRALGYSDAEHIAPKYPVVFQEGRRGRKPEADFVVFAEQPHSRANSLITIEAKHPSEELSGGKEQCESYSSNVRTPLLMISNGRQIQIWQYQPTYESELVLDCIVAELPRKRGEVEALLSREAVLIYARSMRHKSFGLMARNWSVYERAEFERNDSVGVAIHRRLKGAGMGAGEVVSTSLLAGYPNSAVILAASGYGKTLLARDLRRQALERLWCGECSHLPIEVFLPDLPPSRDGLEAFLCARVTAHCPQVSLSAFRDRLRGDGIVLLADGFDRVPAEHRPDVEGALVTFRRDYPNTQVFLFTRAVSRPERLPFPSLELLELNDEEQHDLVDRLWLSEGYAGHTLWHRAPDVLRSVCRHPLILQLTLAHCREKGALPTRIETLFRAWLDRLLPKSLPLAHRTDLRRLLTSFAKATINGPLTDVGAVELVRREGLSDDLLDSLLNVDALLQRGTTVELQHEALADYLRALDLVSLTPAEASQRLKALPLREGSQLPALLMAVATSAEMQRIVWAEIATADIKAAMGALRYRADIVRSDAADPTEVSRNYLSEIIDGIELPLAVHFSRLASRIRFDLAGSNTERLGIAGTVQPASGHVDYSFLSCGPSDNQVTVGRAENANNLHGKSLFAIGLRLDSGRLVGMSHIRESLLDLVRERRLDGSLIWAEERTLGRLRHLADEYELSYSPEMDLGNVRDLLAPNAGSWVLPNAFSAGQTFEISELISEIDLLISHGRTRLERWWIGYDDLDLNTREGQARLSGILDLYYRRTQLAYREVVEASFPMLTDELSFYQVMPLRYEIEIERHTRLDVTSYTLHWKRFPVSTFDEAGATTTFPDRPSEMRSTDGVDAYRRSIDEALARFGRSASDQQYAYGWKGLPDFINDAPTHDGQVGESAVVRAAAARIKDDLERLFGDLPMSDQEVAPSLRTRLASDAFKSS